MDKPIRESGCPCLYTTPCSDNCSCIKAFSSAGCACCCGYGSLEQRKARAKSLVEQLEAGTRARRHREIEEQLAPQVCDVDIKCIVCSVVIKPEADAPDDSPAMRGAYDSGLVHDVHAGYGSKYDCQGFIVGICDNCAKAAINDGRLIHYYNGMAEDGRPRERIE